jgi:hypothetical protein
LVCINKDMGISTIEQIRERVRNNSRNISTQRSHYREFLNSLNVSIDYGLTVTLKQHFGVVDQNGVTVYKKLTVDIVEKIAEEIMKRLNKRLLNRDYTDRKKSLFYIPVYETSNEQKRLHLHFAIGNVPSHISLKKFAVSVTKTLRNLDCVDNEIDLDLSPERKQIVNYLTKTIRDDRTDMILWNRTPPNILSLSF